MKKLHSLLMIMALALVVSSCSKDEKRPTLDPVTSSASQSKNLIAASGTTTIVDKINFSKSSFKELGKNEKWVRSGSCTTKSFIEISGITEEAKVELTNMKLYLVSNPSKFMDLGTVRLDTKYETIDDIKFMDEIVKEVVAKGSAALELTYKTTYELTTPVKFEINLDVVFKF